MQTTSPAHRLCCNATGVHSCLVHRTPHVVSARSTHRGHQPTASSILVARSCRMSWFSTSSTPAFIFNRWSGSPAHPGRRTLVTAPVRRIPPISSVRVSNAAGTRYSVPWPQRQDILEQSVQAGDTHNTLIHSDIAWPNDPVGHTGSTHRCPSDCLRSHYHLVQLAGHRNTACNCLASLP